MYLHKLAPFVDRFTSISGRFRRYFEREASRDLRTPRSGRFAPRRPGPAGHDQAKPGEIWEPVGETVSTTQDLWPYVLVGVLGLFLLDLYAKRVRLFGYRTIKFQ